MNENSSAFRLAYELKKQWDEGRQEEIKLFMRTSFNPQLAESIILLFENKIEPSALLDTYRDLVLDAFNEGTITKEEMIKRMNRGGKVA